jgi:MFS family permease
MSIPETTSAEAFWRYAGGECLFEGRGEAWRDIKAWLTALPPAVGTLHLPAVGEPFLAWTTSGEVDFQEREGGQPWITNRITKGSFFLTTGGAPYDVRWRAVSPEPFETMLVFVVLLFAQRGWGLAWLALTVFATAFVVARLLFGHLADRIGGARVALVSALIEAAGLALIWLAPWLALALFGGAVTGFGYSLVYPGFGVEAVRRAPAESRGLAMGAYTAFLDLALGLANPALGLVAGGAGPGTVFLVSALVVTCSAAVAARLLSVPTVTCKTPSVGTT